MNSSSGERLGPLEMVMAAMASGLVLVVFGGVAASTNASGAAPQIDDLGAILLCVLGVLALGERAAYLLIRRAPMGRTLRAFDGIPSVPDRRRAVLNGFAKLTLIAGTKAEGLGLFGIVVFLVSGRVLGLLAPAVAIILPVLLFPGSERARWFEAGVTGWDV
ncbi:MAG: hypothetical protein ACE5HE_05705 [Phycisphaerae bacterium]